MEFNAKIETEKVEFLLKAAPKRLASALQPALRRAMIYFRGKFRTARLRGRPGLNRRTGALIRSFHVGATPKGTEINDMAAWLASGSKYASKQEYGGEIRPKRRKYLAVPLPAAKTKAGAISGKYIGTIAGQTAPSLYGVKGLWLFKSAAGNLILAKWKGPRKMPGFIDFSKMKRTGGGAASGKKKSPFNIIPLFVLKKSVNIKARMGLRAMFRRWGGILIEKFLNPAIRRTFDRVTSR